MSCGAGAHRPERLFSFAQGADPSGRMAKHEVPELVRDAEVAVARVTRTIRDSDDRPWPDLEACPCTVELSFDHLHTERSGVHFHLDVRRRSDAESLVHLLGLVIRETNAELALGRHDTFPIT